MASKLGMMVKQEAADDRLRDATNRLRVRGVDVGSFPEEGRDRALREVQRTEHTANLLEACQARIDELQQGNAVREVTLTEQEAKLAELEAMLDERDARIRDLEAQVHLATT